MSATSRQEENQRVGQGYFPDAVTTRGQKHLRELSEMAQSGKQSHTLFTVLHSGIEKVSPARHIDANYSQLLTMAQEAGVEVLCYKAELSDNEIQLVSAIEFSHQSSKIDETSTLTITCNHSVYLSYFFYYRYRLLN